MDSADVVWWLGEVVKLDALVHGASIARRVVKMEPHPTTPSLRRRLSEIKLGVARRSLPQNLLDDRVR